MPIITFETKEAIPADLHSEVQETEDGKFEVNLSLTSKVKEFRDNNLALSEERDQLKQKAEKYVKVVGEDVDEFVSTYSKLQETQQAVDDGKLSENKDIEKEIKTRVEAMKSDYETQIKESAATITQLKGNVGNLNKKINNNIVGNAVQGVVNKPDSGIHSSAIADLTRRALDRFVVEDGQLVAKNGDAIIYGPDGATPQTVAEWTDSLKKSDPHLFIASSGGGGGEGNKKLGGLSPADYKKLSSREKLALANKTRA